MVKQDSSYGAVAGSPERLRHTPGSFGRGARGGARLFDIPGVIYPKAVLSESAPRLVHCREIFSVPPEWGISSRHAAGMLGCKVSAAREYMNRLNVCSCRVRQSGGGTRTYWDKYQVRKLAAARVFCGEEIAERFIPVEAVMEMLGVSRTTLARYAKYGLLKVYRMRRESRVNGPRLVNFYLKTQVSQLTALRRKGGASCLLLSRGTQIETGRSEVACNIPVKGNLQRGHDR